MCAQSMQQQLAEEESSGQALRDELNSKDQELLQLHSAVKEVSLKQVSFQGLCNYYRLPMVV